MPTIPTPLCSFLLSLAHIDCELSSISVQSPWRAIACCCCKALKHLAEQRGTCGGGNCVVSRAATRQAACASLLRCPVHTITCYLLPSGQWAGPAGSAGRCHPVQPQCPAAAPAPCGEPGPAWWCCCRPCCRIRNAGAAMVGMGETSGCQQGATFRTPAERLCWLAAPTKRQCSSTSCAPNPQQQHATPTSLPRLTSARRKPAGLQASHALPAGPAGQTAAPASPPPAPHLLLCMLRLLLHRPHLLHLLLP